MLQTIRIALFATMLASAIGLSACTSSPAIPAPAAPAVEYEMPHIKRPNLVVADIERSLKVYRDVLGLEASPIRDGSADSYSYPVFNVPEGQPLRFISFHEPSEQRVLNLTEMKGMDLPSPPSAPYMTAVVIGITDLEAKFAKLEAMGLKTVPPRISSGTDFEFIEQAFVDADGHLIVCYEVLGPPTP